MNVSFLTTQTLVRGCSRLTEVAARTDRLSATMLMQYEICTNSNTSVCGLSCVPMLYIEVNCASLRVYGAAYQSSKFLFEPLTPALHLYCTNNATYMETLAKCVCAIRSTVFKLAQLH